jgi:hypothetical protein
VRGKAKGNIVKIFVNVTPVKTGTAEPVGAVQKVGCPGDIEPDTLLSYLTQQFGEPLEAAWTTTARHPKLQVGWIFPSPAHDGSGTAPPLDRELLVVPFTYDAEGSVIPFFEYQADAWSQFNEIAERGGFDDTVHFTLPQRTYEAHDTSAVERAC